ncbi:hypothetical protein QTP70_003147 [Hemibagrus guttatus]|uniref:Alkylated DNA repair protein AlkB homologue 8 N-terminal domain-containing protein n=1 Tax=Hemibagrus guttatus TaxID=175788 RepID=A0AAE0QIA2_9TELE|nr:hypothetical protein QTP70_003147 [Hemibagrus guttatus]
MGLHFILQHLDKLLQTKLTQLTVPSSDAYLSVDHHCFEHVELQVVKATPGSQLLNLLSVSRLMPMLMPICQWITSFLTDRHQHRHESAYRQEVEQLASWCSLNHLELNTLKTVEMIVDFRRNTHTISPLTIMNSTVPTVESFRFLGTTISQDLKWDTHIDSIIKKAQQRLYFLRQLWKFNLPQELLTQFYSAVIESVLCTSITVWFGSATKSDIRRLQRMVRTAERIIGAPLPTLQELYTSRSLHTDLN